MTISSNEYQTLDAVALAQRIRARELSASEVLEVAIARAQAVDPQIHAIVVPMLEIGRERAAQSPAGPLGGVPFLIKDLFQDYAGVLATSGCSAWRKARVTPTRHAEIVTRWLAAGTVIFGRTNTPEFGAKAVTEPAAFRATCNPWRLTHSAGGSSGGAAAAVAAGIVPMAGAGDGGGSIRIPASSTGLFGLKPGRGRTPNGPEQTEPLHGAVVNHVLSWSVRDSAHMLDATHGPERGGPFVIAPPERPYAEEVVRDPPRLRIAFSTASPIGADVHPEAVRAVEQAAHSLRGLGHEVDEAAPEIDGRALARDFCRIWFANLAWHVEHARDTWQATDADFELESLMLGAIAAATSAPAYVASYNRWNEYAGQLATFLGTYDLYMTPTLALPPPPLGERAIPKSAEALLRVGLRHGLARVLPRATKLIEQVSFETLRGVPFTQLANVCGVPAMSVPLATFSDGMPLGIQFVGDHGDEGMLLSLAAQLERAQPWKDRRPAL